MSGAAYLVGRTPGTLSSAAGAVDTLFAAQRVDGAKMQNLTFEHCTFANVSFKSAEFQALTFSDCTFVGCYFRDTKIYSTNFRGCRFIDSDLTKVDLRTCDLRYYNHFENSRMGYALIHDSLPPEGNLRAHLCSNLADEARKAGEMLDCDRFRQEAARARETHLWSAVTHKTPFFQSKYVGFSRVEALMEWAASKVRGRLWGYKRSWLVILRNWLVLNLAIFPLAFFLVRGGVQRNNQQASISDLWIGSLGNTLPGSGISDVKFVTGPAQFVAFLEVLSAVVFGALLAALIFRSVFERSR